MLFDKLTKSKPPPTNADAPLAPVAVFDADVHQEVKKQKVVLLNYLVARWICFGYDSGIIGSVISPEFIHFHNYFDQPSTKITGAIVSLFAGGAFFGAIGGGMCANTIGRKRTIQLGALVATFGCALQTGANSTGMLMAGRFIAGLAIGMLSMIVPLYQAEISPPHARGLLSGWTQMMISTGFFSANWIGYGCQFLTTDAQWRLPLGIQCIPAIVLFLHEYEEIVTQMEWERENVSSKFTDLWGKKSALHRTACGLLVQVGSQFTGVNVNTYFGPTIYKQLGFTGDRILLINGISGAMGMVETFIFITWMADRIGRRKPLIYGGVGMALCLAWQAGCASAFSGGKIGSESAGIAAVSAMFVFGCVFSFSYGPIAWIYQSEVFSMPLRAMGSSLSTCTYSLFLGNAQVERFLENVTSLIGGCPISTSETIDCLRTVSFEDLLAASQNITSTYDYQMQPRVDGVVLPEASFIVSRPRLPSTSGLSAPSIPTSSFSSDTLLDETDGTATAGVTDDATFRSNFKVIFPAITDWAIDQIETLYPAADFESQGLRFSHATQHYDLVGKVLPATKAYANRTYNYINNLGAATHGSDQSYWWYNSNAVVDTSISIGGGMASSISGNGTEIAKRMQQYLLSFVITGNPNTLFAGQNTTSENGLALLEDGWPLYNGNPTDQVVSFDETGFSIVGDELDSDQVKFWNKALWN
ncbi:major facilitator superfamily domain-containing protein [Mrakia frigida]|uniref:major facilitator superfamily domain-containing protein n=1 Tax=Mrakia frigida TaxID=29902 RepID=UPI003FCBF1B8